jgi:uncharacterized membrane protein
MILPQRLEPSMAMSSSAHRDAAAYPLQSLFVPFPFVCFTLTLATDIAFFMTSNLMWQNFSAWLLFAGLVFGGLGIIAAILDMVRPRTRPLRPAMLASLLYLVILGLAFVNSLVHAGDGWTAVVPYGLALSAVTFVLCLIAAAVSTRKYGRLAWRV